MEIFEPELLRSKKSSLKGIAIWGRLLSWAIISGIAILIIVFVVSLSLEANQRDSFEEFYIFFAILIPFLVPAIFLLLASNHLRQAGRNEDEAAMGTGLKFLKRSFLAATIVVAFFLVLTIGIFVGTYIVESL